MSKRIKEYNNKKPRINVTLSHDWDSFAPWIDCNWRNFTFINFYIETSSFMYELQMGFLGINLWAGWYKGEKSE